MGKDRKRVLDRKDQLSIDDLFDGRSLYDVIIELQEMLHDYEEEIFTHDKDIKCSVERYGYDGGLDIYVNVYRWERDGEYNKRIASEAKKREAARKAKETKKAKALATALTTEQEERALLAKLQEKYGATE